MAAVATRPRIPDRVFRHKASDGCSTNELPLLPAKPQLASVQNRPFLPLRQVRALQRWEHPHPAPSRLPFDCLGNFHLLGLYWDVSKVTSAGQSSCTQSLELESRAAPSTTANPGELATELASEGRPVRRMDAMRASATESYSSDSYASANHLGIGRGGRASAASILGRGGWGDGEAMMVKDDTGAGRGVHEAIDEACEVGRSGVIGSVPVEDCEAARSGVHRAVAVEACEVGRSGDWNASSVGGRMAVWGEGGAVSVAALVSAVATGLLVSLRDSLKLLSDFTCIAAASTTSRCETRRPDRSHGSGDASTGGVAAILHRLASLASSAPEPANSAATAESDRFVRELSRGLHVRTQTYSVS
jgi:hypothetical protein